MIGIGVGIDYALFIVTRYRQGLARRARARARGRRAPSTPPAARCCSPARTVVISLLGLFLMGVDFVQRPGARHVGRRSRS